MGCSDRATYRAQVSGPGWAMLFVSFLTWVNVCNATKKLLGHRSVRPCEAVWGGGFLSCCSEHLPANLSHQHSSLWDSSQNGDCSGCAWSCLRPQPPTCCHSVPPLLLHFPRKRCCRLQRRQGRKSVFDSLILLIPAKPWRKGLTVLVLQRSLALCWVSMDPGTEEISCCFWKMQLDT